MRKLDPGGRRSTRGGDPHPIAAFRQRRASSWATSPDPSSNLEKVARSFASSFVSLVLGQTGFQLAIGMGIGLGLAILLGQGMSFVLFGVAAADVTVLLGFAALLSLTTLVACVISPRRATRVDPMVAMQGD